MTELVAVTPDTADACDDEVSDPTRFSGNVAKVPHATTQTALAIARRYFLHR